MAETGLMYSPDSPYHDCAGFLNSLTEDQASALQALQTRMISASVNLADVAFNSLHPSLTLLRYLRANAFDVERAAEHIERNILWRSEHDVARLCTMQPDVILGCDMQRFTALFPHWHCGFDKQRRPVLYKQYGGFECTELLKMTTVEAVSQYHIWEQEACMRLCMLQSLKSGYLVETITAVIDVAGMQLRQVDANFMAIVKAIANIDQAQYPETLGRFYIINTPYVFPMVWKMVKAFLDPVVASKIHIISKRSDWEPALLDYIGAENLSQTYGGTAPALSAELHPYAEIMATWPKEDSLTDLGPGAAPFSLASPLLPSSGNDNLLNTFSPSLSSPSASTIDSDSEASPGSSAYGDTQEGHDAIWDGTRGVNIPGGSVLGILKSHEGWNYELAFLKASRENRVLTEKKVRSVGFAPSLVTGPDKEAHLPRSRLPDVPSDQARPALRVQSSFASAEEETPAPRKRPCGGACSLLLALLWYLGGCVQRARKCGPVLAPLQSRPISWLLRALKVSLLLFTLLSVCSMAASAYALESLRDVSSLHLEMWTGLVAMLLSALTFLINLTGLFGYYLRNRRLMLMYCACISAIAIAFTAIAVVSSIFLSSSPLVQSYTDKAIGGFGGKSEAKLLLKRYNIIVCAGSWLVAVCAAIPMIFAAAASHKLEILEGRSAQIDEDDSDDFFDDRRAALANRSEGDVGSLRRSARAPSGAEDEYQADGEADVEQGAAAPGALRHPTGGTGAGEWRQWVGGRPIRRKRSISSLLVQKLKSLSSALAERRQLCVVVHVSLIVCLIFSLAMIGYGAYAINYLLSYEFDYPMFAAYSLLYCGVTLIIVVMYGFWVSIMDSPQVIWVQKSVFIPVICLAVTASAALSLGLLDGARKSVRQHRDSYNLSEAEGERLQSDVEIQLLVEGMIGFAVCFFQLVCYVSFRDLYVLALRIDEVSRHVHELILIVEGSKNRSELADPLGPSCDAGHTLPRRPLTAYWQGPRRHSPWATAEWMSDIGRIAQQSVGGAEGMPGILGLDRDVFATDAFGGNGSLRSMYFSREPLTGGLKLVVAMAYYRRWVYLQAVPALTVLEKVLIAWGILVGTSFIYIKGTFVIFSSWVGDDSTPSWIIALWKVMALTDRRYGRADDFLVSTEGFLALVIGPMAIMFAWAILARSSFRHPIGVFCSTADLYTLLLSIALDIRTKFRNVSVDNLTIFVFLFLLVNLIRGLTSLFVLVVESWQIASKADTLKKSQLRRATRRRGGLSLPANFDESNL